jgi:hypothetical protein
MNGDYDPYPSIQQDLNNITLILQKTFEIPAFKRGCDKVFESISKILYRYGLKENNRNLRFRFILCMQEFFDSITQEKWKLKDSLFIKQSEEFAINDLETGYWSRSPDELHGCLLCNLTWSRVLSPIFLYCFFPKKYLEF